MLIFAYTSFHAFVVGALECHIQGDWVLIYNINREARTVTFHHTGSHSDLF
jgi:addiction module RelE/StbE family toxin